MDKRAAVVLGIIFGGLFLALFAFMLLAWSAVKSASPLGLDGDPASTQVGARIGVVEVKGTIGDGQGGADGDKLVKLIRKYDKDDDIKAVVVRIDSPGGAVAPSQEVYSALRGVVVDAGRHRVEMRYRPKSVIAGAIMTALGIAGAVVIFFLAI